MTSSARISAIAAFCKELRQAREYQRISLREASGITRLSVDYLEAIEEGRWDDIPRPYVRGYLSLYAQAVGMNRDKVLKTFDRLMAPETESDSAILDEAPPLLREPEAVGITRAKIRTTWFALLSRNRKLLYTLSFLSVAGLLGLLYVSRRIDDQRTIALIPFGEAMAESRVRVAGPLTELPLDEGQVSGKQSGNWITWVGTGKGWLVVQRDRDLQQRWRFDSYDTIKIQYVTALTARVYPAASAMAFRDTMRVPVNRVTPGDTAIYLVRSTVSGRVDTSQAMTDTLVKS